MNDYVCVISPSRLTCSTVILLSRVSTWNNGDNKVAGKGQSIYPTRDHTGMSNLLCKPCSLTAQEARLHMQSHAEPGHMSQEEWSWSSTEVGKQGRAWKHPPPRPDPSLLLMAAWIPAPQARCENHCTGSRVQGVIINSLRDPTCKICKAIPIWTHS